ncbi:hypothetical protein ORV05_05085 [Amycolatopsis cynarae]|uniref:Helix-turn-helix DNA binding domain protein n=1 Tax=Amycolatopsis cynarae TaxID=2995223 RepID=A0ABY7B5E1_9PSEU|nr:hypothetical protein [Amycolatopsis sp. HUAS 11-8]WAL67167.1 hypothetical protein ORV05_05085 [Amycolatopsis sp. HUAS 11-8]
MRSWKIAGQQEHLIQEERHEGAVVLTSCGWLIPRSRSDATRHTAPRCMSCKIVATPLEAGPAPEPPPVQRPSAVEAPTIPSQPSPHEVALRYLESARAGGRANAAKARRLRDERARAAGYTSWDDAIRETRTLSIEQTAALLGVVSGTIKKWRARLGVKASESRVRA